MKSKTKQTNNSNKKNKKKEEKGLFPKNGLETESMGLTTVGKEENHILGFRQSCSQRP